MLDTFENRKINIDDLPESWRQVKVINELEDFLQRNWEQRYSLFDDEEIERKQQFISFNGFKSISTKKYIGTIIFKGEQLNIYPSVFKEHRDDNKTDNLSQEYMLKNIVQWISYCNKVSYPYINIHTELLDSKNLVELFISLYINYVLSALDRGLYFRYVDDTADIRAIKGRFNIKDYLVNKIPNGRSNEFRCIFSKFEYDNIVNQIIKCVCYKLHNLVKGTNLKRIERILAKLDSVSFVDCKPSDCNNLRFARKDSTYRMIISLSKMFLLNKEFNMKFDINESFCFLFPTYLLFEGFIGGYIQGVLTDEGAKVSLQKSDMKLIDKVHYGGETFKPLHKMRHDIYIEYNDKCFILDTKYKEISRFDDDRESVEEIVETEPKQADIYQVCEYARKRNLEDVYLLYPMYRNEDIEPEIPIGISEDPNKTIKIHFVRIPFVFNDDIAETNKMLKNTIYKMLDIKS